MTKIKQSNVQTRGKKLKPRTKFKNVYSTNSDTKSTNELTGNRPTIRNKKSRKIVSLNGRGF